MLTQSLTVSFAFETWPVYREDMRIAALTKGMQNPVIFLFRPPFLVLAIVNSDTHSVRHSFSFILSFFHFFALSNTKEICRFQNEMFCGAQSRVWGFYREREDLIRCE